MSTPALFQPIQVGDIKLAHRVVLAPQTRYRNDDAHVPTELGLEFYTQRSLIPGTLLITEGVFVSGQASGQPNAPGIWTDAQVAAWKKITDAVHKNGSFIYAQLWALGRAARPALFHKEFPDYPYVAASPIPLSSSPEDVPRELTNEEIKDYHDYFAQAAINAIQKAGFDGVEIHGANGYLPDQFLQDVSNTRTDEYGGSVENRARFMLEIVDAVVAAVGPKKTALRLSPWSRYQDMRMDSEEKIKSTFSHVATKIKEKHPDLAYIHLVSSGGPGSEGFKDPADEDFLRQIWAPRALITTGGYDRESGLKLAEETGQIIGYGRAFTANPDLPFRLEHNLDLNACDYDKLYTAKSPKGYIDYPFSAEFLAAESKKRFDMPTETFSSLKRRSTSGVRLGATKWLSGRLWRQKTSA